MAKKRKTNDSSKSKNQQKNVDKSSKNKFSYLAFYSKDIVLCILLLLGLAYFVQGSFYTNKEVKKYEKQVRAYLSSNATQAEKDKVSKEKKTNINRIKVKWGYFFAYNNLLKENFKRIKDNPEIEYKNKVFSKSGAWGYIMHTIAENTPENAQILIPLTETELRDKNYSFQYGSNQVTIPANNRYKKYINWFIYPRTVVFDTAADQEKKVSSTHVIIFDKKGAQYADNPSGQQLQNFGIYPYKNS